MDVLFQLLLSFQKKVKLSTKFNKYVLDGQAADLDGFTTLLCTFKHVENITHGSNQTVNKAWMNESIGSIFWNFLGPLVSI